MEITYNTKKDLPCEALQSLFEAVGWSDDNVILNPDMLANFNKPFINSTMVISAWDQKRLVGCVRVIGDQMFRSVIYDLAVLPVYQGKGIGTELVRRCMEAFPNAEWLVGTESAADFYKNIGFVAAPGTFLHIPCNWF